MKVLQICNKPPFPPNDGGTIAMNNVTKGLFAAGANVKVLALATPKHPFLVGEIPTWYKERHHPEVSFVESLPTFWGVLKGIFSSESYHISRFYSEEFEAKIVEQLKTFNPDIVLLESLFLANYLETIKKYSKGMLIYRAHNIEHILWVKRVNKEKNPLKKMLLKPLLPKLKKEEIELWDEVNGIAAITYTDADHIRDVVDTKVDVFPFGFDFRNFKCDALPQPTNSLIYIGALDWEPNIEGLLWFVENCWPSIREKYPDWTFKIAGRNAVPKVLSIEADGIEFLGEIPDAAEFYKQGSIMVVPLFSGSGMRVKIIESMACGTPVVTTSQGIEGIDLTKDESYLLAEGQNQFIDAISSLIEDEKKRNLIAENARKFVEQQYDCYKTGNRMYQFFKSFRR